MLMGPRVPPVPLRVTFVGLAWLVALCVIDNVPEDAPVAVGENRTVTDLVCPGARLKAPPPLTTEKGAVRLPTLPVRVPVELVWLVIVIV